MICSMHVLIGLNEALYLDHVSPALLVNGVDVPLTDAILVVGRGLTGDVTV